MPEIETDPEALAEYLIFQYPISNRTLFRHVTQLLPGHALTVDRGQVRSWRYWDVQYDADHSRSPEYFQERLRALVDESTSLHLRSDVPVGSYLSGGIDSSLIAILASRTGSASNDLFHGKFSAYPECDESAHAATVARQIHGNLHQVDIGPDDFVRTIEKIVYHLDYPVAGPGSFPQYMVSELAAQHVKVVLGGQGGDEIFGGYARYLIAYFEQCIRAAIDGTYRGRALRRHGRVDHPEPRRAPGVQAAHAEALVATACSARSTSATSASWTARTISPTRSTGPLLDRERVFDEFRTIFNNPDNVSKTAYFDKMTHFDFKCLLPGLLQVEDRMSMAHGLESRVPFLDHPLIEFVATVPADVKFRDGQMKHLLKEAFATELPPTLLDRRDKMGFPVPLQQWTQGPEAPLRDFVNDIFRSSEARSRPFVDANKVIAHLDDERPFGRKLWGLLSLELWHRCFHDRAHEYRALVEERPVAVLG